MRVLVGRLENRPFFDLQRRVVGGRYLRPPYDFRRTLGASETRTFDATNGRPLAWALPPRL